MAKYEPSSIYYWILFTIISINTSKNTPNHGLKKGINAIELNINERNKFIELKLKSSKIKNENPKCYIAINKVAWINWVISVKSSLRCPLNI